MKLVDLPVQLMMSCLQGKAKEYKKFSSSFELDCSGLKKELKSGNNQLVF
jgi:hypothetical protein